jgi:hypothetical protein
MDRLAPIRWIVDCAQWLWHPYREHDRRRNLRLAADIDVTIVLPLGVLNGRTINMSRTGASVVVPEEVAPGATVYIRVPTIDRGGFASVRRCTPHGDGYEVALQFTYGLTLDDRCLADFQYERVNDPGAWIDDRS